VPEVAPDNSYDALRSAGGVTRTLFRIGGNGGRVQMRSTGVLLGRVLATLLVDSCLGQGRDDPHGRAARQIV